jgi:hypothetical protein
VDRGAEGRARDRTHNGRLVLLRHKLPLGVIPGRWQVGFAGKRAYVVTRFAVERLLPLVIST